jgi:hypothetical protein
VEDFTEAVRRHYWYEFFADDLPIWGFVGPPPEQTKGDSNVYIYTHKTFDIAYNGDRVGAGWQQAEAALSSRAGLQLPAGVVIMLPQAAGLRAGGWEALAYSPLLGRSCCALWVAEVLP